jgi:hypothetical protein
VLEIEFPIYAATDLFESKTIRAGMKRDVPGGATIELLPIPVQKRSDLAFDAAPILTIVVTSVGTVGLNLFSSWLYETLSRSKTRYLKINRRKVEITPDGIYRAIEETIEVEERTQIGRSLMDGRCSLCVGE